MYNNFPEKPEPKAGRKAPPKKKGKPSQRVSIITIGSKKKKSI